MVGFSPDNDVIFEYRDTVKNFTQKLGFNLKYYRAHQIPDYRFRHPKDGLAEGAYLFKVDLQHLYPFQFGALDQDVSYEKGQFLEQWTINYVNTTNNQTALVKVRFS